MTSIQLFHHRDFPGHVLRANALQALERLGMDIPVQETETAPDRAGHPLPALAIDGNIVVSGVEPSVRELELLFEDYLRQEDEDSPCGACGMECGGMHGADECPMCRENGDSHSMAGKIIGFVILLIILFTAVKILS